MIKSLTGIRFWLFLFVLINHIYTNIVLQSAIAKAIPCGFWGSYAVLFFFILSGFCIAINNTDKFNNFSFKEIKDFCYKRVAKFYPLYIITGLICLIFYYLPMNIKWLNAFIFLYIPMLQPFSPWKHGGGNGTAWFLAALFFCYIFTPLFLYLLNKLKSLKGLLISYIVLYTIMIGFAFLQIRLNPPDGILYYLYHFPPLRFLHYFSGLILGVIYIKYLKEPIMFAKNIIAKSFLDIILLGLFIIGLFYDLKTSGFSIQYGASLHYEHVICIPLFSFITLYLCNNTKGFLSLILENKLIMFLGKISFECYLIHYIFIVFLKQRLTSYCNNYIDVVLIILFLLALTVISALFYKYVINKVIQQIINKGE